MNLLRYIGHFHPVLVHLPIGILLASLALEWLSRRKGFRKLRKAIRMLLLLGFFSAVLSCVTGYILSQSGEYDADLLNTHQWLGIFVAIISGIAFTISPRKLKERRLSYAVVMVALAVLIVLTGHAGGKLTHGIDFLAPPPLASWFDAGGAEDFQSVNLKTAAIYQDLVAPILERKCKSCHGPSRQKGKLRLDQPSFIVKGGKDGPIIDSHAWRESEIYKRIHLDVKDDDHMPPKDKNQLSQKEISLLSFWIKTGADFKMKLSALPGADSVSRILADGDIRIGQEKREETIPAPDAAILAKLRGGGVVISFRAAGNGFASFNFEFADTARVSGLVGELPKIHQQVVELKLKECRLSPQGWSTLAGLTSVTRLNLANSNVSDRDIGALQQMKQLRDLNLVGTKVTLSGIGKLKSLPGLSQLFLYRTPIHESELTNLRTLFPGVSVDFGNYAVPTTRDDTTVLTKPLPK